MAFKKAPAAFAAGAFLFSANFSASGGHALCRRIQTFMVSDISGYKNIRSF